MASYKSLVVLVAFAFISVPASAQNSLLTDFYFRASNSAVNTRDLFQWPMTTDMDAVLRIEVPAATNASVLLVVVSAGEIVAKHKSKHDLVVGRNELRLPKVFATDRVLGQRLLTAQLELAVKGYPTEKRGITFEVKGPPQPKVQILSLRLYPPNAEGTTQNQSTQSTTQFEVGQPFMCEVVVSVLDNPANLKPRLIVLGSMTEDDQHTGYDLPRQTYDDHYDLREIELDEGQGVRRIVLRGSLPHFFASPWQNHHPFHIYAAVDFGSGTRVVQHVESSVFDFFPSEQRRDDDPARRLIQIARATSWSVGAPGMPAGGVPEPVQ